MDNSKTVNPFLIFIIAIHTNTCHSQKLSNMRLNTTLVEEEELQSPEEAIVNRLFVRRTS